MKLILVLVLLIMFLITTHQSPSQDISQLSGDLSTISKGIMSSLEISGQKKNSKLSKLTKTGTKIFSSLVKAKDTFSKVMNFPIFKVIGAVGATISILNFILPGLGPAEAESPWVDEIRENFKVMNREFGVVKDKLDHLKDYVQEQSSQCLYSDYIISIRGMELFFEEYVNASASIRIGYAESFVENYDVKANNIEKLYIGLTEGETHLSISKNAISYTKGDLFKKFLFLFIGHIL